MKARKAIREAWRSTCGRVRLYRGDAIAILPRMKVGCVHGIFTDPPYGHGNNNGDLISRREAALGRGIPGPPRPIANDGPEANDLFQRVLPLLNRVLLSGCCCCCCCGGGGPDPQFARWSLWLDQVFRFKQMVVWDKGPMGLGWHYRRSYETVLVAEKRGAKGRWYGGRSVENIIRPGDGIRKIIPRASDHPTPKPVALAKHFIRLHTLPGETVLDPFMGGGSTAVAAIESGRKFVGIEIDPRWLRKSVRRCREALAANPL